MYYDEKTRTIYAAFRYPGFVEHVGALDTRDGTETRLAEINGAKLYKVASFAYDPASGTAFFTNDNTAYRDLMSVDVHTGEQQLLLKDARIGEIAFNPVGSIIDGRTARLWPDAVRAHPVSLRFLATPSIRSRTAFCPMISTFPPTDGCCRHR